MRRKGSPTNHRMVSKKKKKHDESSSSSVSQAQVLDTIYQGFISKLPIEISFNILLRVPMKTLCHCRYVSKAWQTTIKHPCFIKIHQAKVVQTNSPGLIFLNKDSHRQLYFVDHQCLDAFLCDSTQPVENPLNRWTQEEVMKFIRRPEPEVPSVKSITLKTPKQMGALFSCNGMVFSGKEPFFICNPITGEYIDIPNPPIYPDRLHLAMGFGFDAVSNVFKIVRMVFVMNECYAPEMDVEVYNSGTGKWKAIHDLPYFVSDDGIQSDTNVFLNGALHWIGSIDKPKASVGIVLFDLHIEEFRLLPGPSEFELCSWKSHHYLLVLGDCLCICHKVRDEHIKIYVMKEYGMESSWVKEYSIKDLEWDYSDIEGPYKPVKLMKNGEILVLCFGTVFGYYNPKTKVFRVLDVCVGSSHSQPALHAPSLISPKNKSIQQREKSKVKGRC